MHLRLNFIFVFISAQNSYLFSFQLIVEMQLATHLRLVRPTQGLHLQFLFFLTSARCTHWYIVNTCQWVYPITQKVFISINLWHFRYLHASYFKNTLTCIIFLICYYEKKTQSIAAWIKLDNSPGKRNDEKGKLLQALTHCVYKQSVVSFSSLIYGQTIVLATIPVLW